MITYSKTVQVSTYVDGHPQGGGSGSGYSASTIPWSQVTATPTTLSGYGITDGLTQAVADTLYEPIITPKNTAFNKNFAGSGVATTVSRSDHNHSLGSLSDVDITAIGGGELLTYSGGNWINQTFAELGLAEVGHNLDTHGDVSITTPANFEILRYSNGSWINNTYAEAGLYGFNNAPNLNDLGDVDTSMGVVDGSMLYYNFGNSSYESTNTFLNLTSTKFSIGSAYDLYVNSGKLRNDNASATQIWLDTQMTLMSGGGFRFMDSELKLEAITAPTNDQALLGKIYNDIADGNLKYRSAAGVVTDLTAAAGATTFSGLTDTNVTGLQLNDILRWDGADWIPQNEIKASNLGLKILDSNPHSSTPLGVGMTAAQWIKLGSLRILQGTNDITLQNLSDLGIVTLETNTGTNDARLQLHGNTATNRGQFLLQGGQPESDLAPADSYINGAYAFAGATTNQDGGNLYIDGGVNASGGGIDGNVFMSVNQGRTVFGQGTDALPAISIKGAALVGKYGLNYTTAQGNLSVSLNGTKYYTFDTGIFNAHNTSADLGSTSLYWRDIYLNPQTASTIADDSFAMWNSTSKKLTYLNVTGTPSSSTYFRGDGSWATLGAGVTDLADLGDVTSATQTSGFVLASSGGDYIGRALLTTDIPDLSATYLTGNESITLTGDLSGSGATTINSTIVANAVTFAKMQEMPTGNVLGNFSGSTTEIASISAASLTSNLVAFSTTTTNQGVVIGSNNVGATYFLNGSGAWSIPTGGITGTLVDRQIPVATGASSVASYVGFEYDATLTGSSGIPAGLIVSPEIDQSGTAGYRVLHLNANEDTAGSGQKDLLYMTYDSSYKGRVDTTGRFFMNSAEFDVIPSTGTFSSSYIATISSGGVVQRLVSAGASTGRYLKDDGTWDTPTAGSGTVTSVSGTGTVAGLTLTGTVTTSGSLTLGGTLASNSIKYNMLDDNIIASQTNLSAPVAADEMMIHDLNATATNRIKRISLTTLATYLDSNLSYNSIIGTDTDIAYTVATVLATVTYTDGVATAHTSRTLTLANLGYTGSPTANNYVHPNHSGHVSSVADGATTLLVAAITGQTATTTLTGTDEFLVNDGGAIRRVDMNRFIVGQTNALASGLLGSDELLISDAGTVKRMDVSVMNAYFNANLAFSNNAGTVTSVGTTGSVNGITLTGTVTTSGNLTLGGTLGNIANSQLTNSTISGVALGSNLPELGAGVGINATAGNYNGVSATVFYVDLSDLSTGTDMVTSDYMVYYDVTASASEKALISGVKLSLFNNDSGWTSNVGSVIAVSGGTGISSTGGASPEISLTAAGIGAGSYGSTSSGTKINLITVDAYGRITAISTGGTGIGAMTNFNVQANGGTQVSVTQAEEVNFINGTGLTAAVVNQLNPTVQFNLNEATATVRGGVELFSNTDQSVVANAVSTTAARTYGIQLNSGGQMVVNVPWTAGGSGDVTKVGTPVDNQLAVWTGNGTLEGESEITYSGTILKLEKDNNAPLSLEVININAGVSATARVVAKVDSASIADPYFLVAHTSRSYAIGMDHNDSNIFKIRTQANDTATPSIGTSLFEISTTGILNIPNNPVAGDSVANDEILVRNSGTFDVRRLGIGTGLSISGGDLIASGGGIGGSIADTQIAYGSGTDIAGSSSFTYVGGGQLVVGGLIAGGTANIQLGHGRTGSGYAYIDLIGDTTYSDYGLRLLRSNGGANTASEIIHRGTGDFNIETAEAADIKFYTNSVLRVTFDTGGGIIGTNEIQMPTGTTTSDPQYTATNDGDTGMQLWGSNKLSLNTAGANRLEISAAGDVYVHQNLHLAGSTQFYIDASTTRQGLMRTVEAASNSYAGYEAYFSGTAQWSFMGNETLCGVYDDVGNDWGWQMSENAGLRIYYNSSQKFTSTNTGITVSGTGSATDWSATSDRRLKTNIKYNEKWFDRVLKIGNKIVRYDWKNIEEGGENNVGLIAQDVLKIAPEFVHTWQKNMNPHDQEDADNMKPIIHKEYYALNYSKLVAPLYSAFAEKHKSDEVWMSAKDKEIMALKNRVTLLETEVKNLNR